MFALLLAAAVHDLAHPGVTNDFLVRTRHALAARFGGAEGGVNERHHVASFLGLLDDPATDAFAGLSDHDQQRVRASAVPFWRLSGGCIHDCGTPIGVPVLSCLSMKLWSPLADVHLTETRNCCLQRHRARNREAMAHNP